MKKTSLLLALLGLALSCGSLPSLPGSGTYIDSVKENSDEGTVGITVFWDDEGEPNQFLGELSSTAEDRCGSMGYTAHELDSMNEQCLENSPFGCIRGKVVFIYQCVE